jgi:hypothetical protein
MGEAPISELDLVAGSASEEANNLREWSYLFGLGSQEFTDRYSIDEPFFSSRSPNYSQIWMVFCELLFSLRRPHGGVGEFGNQPFGKGGITNFWWNKHKDDPESYLVYPEDEIKYGWVLYLDIESAPDVVDLVTGQVGNLDNGTPVFRRDINMIFKGEGPESGGSESGSTLTSGGVEPIEPSKSTTPIDIPEFPKWSDKIKDKFHRSVDKDMSEWDKSLDEWQTELQNTLVS